MEATIGAAGLAQLAISGLAFLQHMPEIQSDYSKLSSEICFIRALCEDALNVAKQSTNPNLRPIEDSLVLQTKVALEEIHNQLEQIKQGCERAGESEAMKRKWILKEAKISALLSKAEAAKTDLGLAMGMEAAADGKESLRLQSQTSMRLGNLERKMERRSLLARNEAATNHEELVAGQDKLSGQVGDVEREMLQQFLDMKHEATSNSNELIKRQDQIDKQMREFNLSMNKVLEIEKILQHFPRVMGVAIQERVAISQPGNSSITVQEPMDDRDNGKEAREDGRAPGLGVSRDTIANDKTDEQTTTAFLAVRRARCPYDCRCQCHTKPSFFASPRWAVPLIGSWKVQFRPFMTRSQWERSCPCAGSEYMAVEWRPPRWPNIQLLVYTRSFSVWTPRPVRVVPRYNPEWRYFNQPLEYFQKAYQEGMIVYPDDADETGVYLLERVVNNRAFDMLEFLLSQWANMLPKQGLARRVGKSAHRMLRLLGNGHDTGTRLMQKILSFVEDHGQEPVTTPLHEAAIRGSGVQEALGDLGIPVAEAVDIVDASGMTPLLLATLYGHCNAVKQLLDAGADVNGKGVYSQEATPLIYAAMKDRVEIMQQLLSTDGRRNKPRCRINEQDQEGCTALHWAAKHCHYRAVQLLLEKGASALARDSEGWTPLHYAVSRGPRRIQNSMAIKAMLNALLETNNADIDIPCSVGYTAFSLSLAYNTPIAFHLLENAGAAHNVLTVTSRNILHIVALTGNLDTLSYLQSLNLDGISIHQEDSGGNTPWDLFIDRLCTPIWRCVPLRKPSKAESDAFVLLYRNIRDQNIHRDLEHLQQALDALSVDDPMAACSFIRQLAVVKRNCGELGSASFYSGIEKDIHAGGHEAPANAIRDEIQDLQSEMAADPWDAPSYWYRLGDLTFREPDPI